MTKTLAYVFLYSTVEGVNIGDCTLTLAGARKPAKMLDYLGKTLGHRVEKNAEGAYYVHGVIFPVQIIETKRLPGQENLWLNGLRDAERGGHCGVHARAYDGAPENT